VEVVTLKRENLKHDGHHNGALHKVRAPIIMTLLGILFIYFVAKVV